MIGPLALCEWFKSKLNNIVWVDWGPSGTEKLPQRTCATKISAELSGEFSGTICLKTLVLFCSSLQLFRKFFGAVRAIFGLWGSFLALEANRLLHRLRQMRTREAINLSRRDLND